MEAADVEEDPWPRAFGWSALAIALGFVLNPVFLFDYSRACRGSSSASCLNNLRTMQGAKDTWAIENAKGTNAIPTTNDLFGETLYIKRVPICPSGGAYTLNAANQKPTCSVRGHTL